MAIYCRVGRAGFDPRPVAWVATTASTTMKLNTEMEVVGV